MKRLFYFLLGAVLFASCNDSKSAKIEQQNPPVAWNGKLSDLKIYLTNAHHCYSDEEMDDYCTTSFANLSETYFSNEAVEKNPLLKGDDFQKDTIVLEGERRALFLKHTHISEEDKLFIYDFKNKISKEFLVKDLPVMACLNVYSERPSQESEEYLEWVFSGYAHFDYEYGFDLGKKYKNQEYAEAFTFVGKENPFVEGNIQRIKWEKIAQKDIPVSVSESYLKEHDIDFQKLRFKEAYQFTSGKEWVIAQDFIYTEEEIEYEMMVRYFIVLDTEKQTITNQFFIQDGEFGEILPFEQINEDEYSAQYFGQLFKGKSSVFLNLENRMFGCENIYFSDAKDLPVNILCDNRH